MLFPETERVLYAKNPLEQVICQLRFPAILRIGREVPASFQDRVRERFPLYSERLGLEIPADAPPQVARALVEAQPAIAFGVRDFASEDARWKLSLSHEFLALTCTNYVRWEEFRDHLRYAWEALVKEYQPAFVSRVGLRYQNAIQRSILGLGDVPWSELLEPHIAAELADAVVGPRVRDTQKAVVIELDEAAGFVCIRHGIRIDQGSDEQIYVLDNDFFREKRTEDVDVFPLLDTYHVEAGRLFRWCLSDRLHTALGPEPV